MKFTFVDVITSYYNEQISAEFINCILLINSGDEKRTYHYQQH